MTAAADPAGAALELWRSARAADGLRPSAAAVQEQAAVLADPAALLVVDDGGFALGRVRDDLLVLDQLVVHPSVRRQGRGSALAEALADAAWERGARRLHATPGDDPARAFLLAVGLEPAGDGALSAELEAPVAELVVREAGLRLGQLLKLAGLVETGAEGKALLEAGGVQVDGEVEQRRGRQLRDGEVVTARDRAVRVVLPPG